jgi:hypothetical protein
MSGRAALRITSTLSPVPTGTVDLVTTTAGPVTAAAILPAPLSTQITSCPKSAKQASDTRPT